MRGTRGVALITFSLAQLALTGGGARALDVGHGSGG